MSGSSDVITYGETSLTTITYRHQWTITHFSQIVGMNCKKGDKLNSPIFSVGENNERMKWQLQISPSGDNTLNKNYVGLYIVNKSDKGVNSTIELALLNKKKETVVKLPFSHSFMEGQSWGFSKFVKRDYIMDKNNLILADDTLTIICEISIVTKNNSVYLTKCPHVVLEKCNGCDQIRKVNKTYDDLFKNGNFSDIIVLAEGKDFHLHKSILATQSPVFETMFRIDMVEKEQSRVEIRDVKYEVLKELFRFMYTGNVINLKMIAIDLYVAANKYLVNELLELCEKSLCNTLTIDNAIKYLNFAEKYSAVKLKSQSINFIALHSKKIVHKPEFKLLNVDIMADVTQAIVNKI